MSEWTYHAQDALTGTWLHRDLPLADVEITDVLSGHGVMTAVVRPETSDLWADGKRILQEWQTKIYAEKFGMMRFAGILTTSRFSDDGQEWHLTIESFTAYAMGEPYNKTWRQWQPDALDAVREIWGFLQNRPNGDLGLTVDQDMSGVLLGDEQPPAKPRRADVTYPVGSEYGPAGYPWPRPPKPRRPKRKRPKKRKRRRKETFAHYQAYLSRFADRLARWKADKDSNYVEKRPQWNAWWDRLEELQSRWETDYGSREPYKLLWWEHTDCSQELERLSVETPFDWRERHTWNGDKTAVNHRLQLGYPTIGTRKTDKTFVPGVDLVLSPEVHRGGSEYANAIIGIGAGEGRKTVRKVADVDDGRLRRVGVYTAKNVRGKKRLERLADHERKRRTLGHHTFEVVVWDTDGNLGSYRLGDEIQVDLTEGWAAGQRWHKIIARRYKPDEDDVLYWQLVRADRA